LVSQIATQAISSLIAQFGSSNILGALTNIFQNAFGNALKGVIDNSPLPQFLKDAAKSVIDDVLGRSQMATTPEAQYAVENSDAGQSALSLATETSKSVENKLIENMQNDFTEEAKGKDQKQAKGGQGLNWLAALAMALGEVAGQHMQEAARLAHEIGELGNSTSDAKEMTRLQAKMQGEAKMGGLLADATGNVIKTIGDALASLARKQ
jgi:hypothetical protein